METALVGSVSVTLDGRDQTVNKVNLICPRLKDKQILTWLGMNRSINKAIWLYHALYHVHFKARMFHYDHYCNSKEHAWACSLYMSIKVVMKHIRGELCVHLW